MIRSQLYIKERIAMRKERHKCVPMEESAFHQWMEDKAKYQGWLDSQSNQVNQSSTLTSTSNSSTSQQNFKMCSNYNKKVNKIQIGVYILCTTCSLAAKKHPKQKIRVRVNMYGTVMKSHSLDEWEVKFDNGTLNILKSNQIQLTKGLKGEQSKQQPELFSNLLSPLSQNSIEKEMVLDGDDDDSDDGNEFNNLPVLEKLKPLKKTAKKVVSSDATTKTRNYIDDSSSDESYLDDDDNSDDDSDDGSDDGSYDGHDDDDDDGDVLLIEDSNDDDDDKLLPIHYSQLSEHDKNLWNANRKVQGLEGKTTECTTGTGNNKKKVIWTLVFDHQPLNPVQTQSSAYLGIWKKEILDKLEKS
jgi:hypothetical protein